MKYLKSRTLWTLALVAAIGAWQALAPFMSSEMYMLVNSVLLALAGYFRINVRVK